MQFYSEHIAQSSRYMQKCYDKQWQCYEFTQMYLCLWCKYHTVINKNIKIKTWLESPDPLSTKNLLPPPPPPTKKVKIKKRNPGSRCSEASPQLSQLFLASFATYPDELHQNLLIHISVLLLTVRQTNDSQQEEKYDAIINITSVDVSKKSLLVTVYQGYIAWYLYIRFTINI